MTIDRVLPPDAPSRFWRRRARGRRAKAGIIGLIGLKEIVMQLRVLRWSALFLACLLAGGCKDRHEPVKPTAPAVHERFLDL